MKSNGKQTAAPLVSIIIPVFNKCDLTIQCLNALFNVSGSVPFEVIVVDNASTDGTEQRLKPFAGKIRFIRNEANRGFAGACNQGATAASGKNLLFLNNDTIPLKNWLEPLVEELRLHPEVVMVGSKLLYDNGLVQHAGVAFERESRNPYHPYRWLRGDDARVNRRRELQAVTAACMLIRTKWFNECGRFHEEFRNGYEDLDLCLNVRKAGGLIVYQPKSVLFHLESQTPGRLRNDTENRRLFFQRWNDRILSDEDAFYFDDGYCLHYAREAGQKGSRLAKFANDEDRRRWQTVAKTQFAAAAGNTSELIELLANQNAWPQDAGIRQWAGVICARLNLHTDARRHFEAVHGLASDPEIRLRLGVDQHTNLLAWEKPLQNAFQQVLLGVYVSAQIAFDKALHLGAPPRLVLPGLREASLNSGAASVAETTARALTHLPRLDAHSADSLKGGVAGAKKANAVANAPEHQTASAPEGDLVSIIILVHDQLDHTKRCLQSIEQFTPQPHELFLVDNASGEETRKWLEQYASVKPHARLIRNSVNRGFAAGNNQALPLAKGDFILFLNNDTVVTAGWLKNQLAVFRQHPATGIVGPRSNRVAGPQLVENPRYGSLEQLEAFAADWCKEHAGQSRSTNRIIGFCLLARRSVIGAIGGLDEQFGSGNFEDDDYCIRARIVGFEARIADGAFVHHVGGQTFAGARIDYRQAMLRNWELFKTKWNLPAEAPIEKGYRMPATKPANIDLKITLPKLRLTHGEFLDGRGMTDEILTAAAGTVKSAKIELPACALLGNLSEARELLKKREFAIAWTSATKAIAARPFHPDGYLTLGEIALAVGDSVSARRCAQFAHDLAPDWKPARKFLNGNLRGSAKPEWLQLPAAITDPNSAPRLSVCLIVRNEEQFLARCLESVREIAAQIVVVDTGSTDRTVEIARAHGTEVHSFTWCDDFSAARNTALAHATGDWVLVLDADEELLPEHRKTIVEEVQSAKTMAYRLPIFDKGREREGCSYVPRLFRNAPGLFFVGRIHEQVFTSIEVRRKEWGLENRLGKSALLHHGYQKEVVASRNKVERNLRLLEKAIEEMPGEPNLLMNLGLELVRSGQLERGLENYRDAFRQMSALPAGQATPELVETLLTQMCSHLMSAKRPAEIIQILQSPLAKSTALAASLHFVLGLAHLQSHQPAEAAEQMRQCLAKRKLPALSPVNSEIFGAGPNHCLALCLAAKRDLAAAEAAFKAALVDDPKSLPARIDFAKFNFNQGKPVEALQVLNDLNGDDPKHLQIWQLGGQIALSRPDFREFALDWTGEAVKHFPLDPLIKVQRAEALTLNGDFSAALPLWVSAHSPKSATHLAALALCEIAEGNGERRFNGAEEKLVSQEFMKWYQRLIAAGAKAAIQNLHDRIDLVRAVVPTFAQLLDAAVSQVKTAAAATA